MLLMGKSTISMAIFNSWVSYLKDIGMFFKIPWNLERGKAMESHLFILFPHVLWCGVCVFDGRGVGASHISESLGASCRRSTYHNIIHVGKTTINHPFGNCKHTTYLWWFGGWFMALLYPDYDFWWLVCRTRRTLFQCISLSSFLGWSTSIVKCFLGSRGPLARQSVFRGSWLPWGPTSRVVLRNIGGKPSPKSPYRWYVYHSQMGDLLLFYPLFCRFIFVHCWHHNCTCKCYMSKDHHVCCFGPSLFAFFFHNLGIVMPSHCIYIYYSM